MPLPQRHSQMTDSKDSKLSDDPDMIHDGSVMQPKNQQESYDSKLTGGDGAKFTLPQAYKDAESEDTGSNKGRKITQKSQHKNT